MIDAMKPGNLRRQFRSRLLQGLQVVWPILLALLACIASLGLTVALLEGYSLFEGVYFAFVSGLTIGFFDILLGGLVAAVGVNALNASQQAPRAT